ncbi:MAG: hypothetical protein KIT33_07290 [Candidatus Kapabacteria bacterium]|nr:hypothetical protein [Ignavibacteriota bacterium]MCW5884758.1 hypothetical protein [Candidatus Kapabacteria bacterium]
MKNFPIFIEGYLDESIINQTVDLIAKQSKYQITRKDFFIDRAKGINAVLNRVIKIDKSCIGIIDDDKVKSNIIDKFQHCGSLGNLNFYYSGNHNTHKFVIVFVPASEKWIIDSANTIGIDNTTTTLKEFTKFSKSHIMIEEIQNIVKKVIFGEARNAVIFRRIIFGIIKRY